MHQIHYLAITDPDPWGPVALCDVAAGLDEEPRYATESSRVRSEVTCPICLRCMHAASVTERQSKDLQ